eukprot:8892379-Karenia_brevis.AAC.1
MPPFAACPMGQSSALQHALNFLAVQKVLLMAPSSSEQHMQCTKRHSCPCDKLANMGYHPDTFSKVFQRLSEYMNQCIRKHSIIVIVRANDFS